MQFFHEVYKGVRKFFTHRERLYLSSLKTNVIMVRIYKNDENKYIDICTCIFKSDGLSSR